MPEPVREYPRPSRVERSGKHVRVVLGGAVIADAPRRTLVPRPTEADWLAAPAWSPDGSRLALIQRDNRLGVARTDGTDPRLIADLGCFS